MSNANIPAAPFPPGTRIEKSNYEIFDGHQAGKKGTVLDSIGPIQFQGQPDVYGYFVFWDDTPHVPVFVAGNRIRPIDRGQEN